jgi:hypothetical protein
MDKVASPDRTSRVSNPGSAASILIAVRRWAFRTRGRIF